MAIETPLAVDIVVVWEEGSDRYEGEDGYDIKKMFLAGAFKLGGWLPTAAKTTSEYFYGDKFSPPFLVSAKLEPASLDAYRVR